MKIKDKPKKSKKKPQKENIKKNDFFDPYSHLDFRIPHLENLPAIDEIMGNIPVTEIPAMKIEDIFGESEETSENAFNCDLSKIIQKNS